MSDKSRSRTTGLPRPFLDFLTKRRSQRAPDTEGAKISRIGETDTSDNWRMDAAKAITTGDISTFKSGTVLQQQLALWESINNVPKEKIKLLVPSYIFEKSFNPKFAQEFGLSVANMWFERTSLAAVFYQFGEDMALQTTGVSSAKDIISGSFEEIIKKIRNKDSDHLEEINEIVMDILSDITTLKEYFPGIDELNPEIEVKKLKEKILDFKSKLINNFKFEFLIDDFEMLEYVMSGSQGIESLIGINTEMLMNILEGMEGLITQEPKFIEQLFLPDEFGRRLLKEEIYGRSSSTDLFKFLFEEEELPLTTDLVSAKLCFFIYLGIKHAQQFDIQEDNDIIYEKIKSKSNKERIHFLVQEIRVTKAPNVARIYVKEFIDNAGTSKKRDEMINLLDKAMQTIKFLPPEKRLLFLITMVRNYGKEHKDPKIKLAFNEISTNGITINDYLSLSNLILMSIKGNERLKEFINLEKNDPKYYNFLQLLIVYVMMKNRKKSFANNLKMVLDAEDIIRKNEEPSIKSVRALMKNFLQIAAKESTTEILEIKKKIETTDDRDILLIAISDLLERLMLINDFRLGNFIDSIILEIISQETQKLSKIPSFSGNKGFLYDFIQYKKREAIIKEDGESVVKELATIEQRLSYAKKNAKIYNDSLIWAEEIASDIQKDEQEFIASLAIIASINVEAFGEFYKECIKGMITFLYKTWKEFPTNLMDKRKEFLESQARKLETILHYSVPNKGFFQKKPLQVLSLILIHKMSPLLTELYEEIFDYDKNAEERDPKIFNLLGNLIAKGYNKTLFEDQKHIPSNIIPVEGFLSFSFSIYLSKIFDTYKKSIA